MHLKTAKSVSTWICFEDVIEMLSWFPSVCVWNSCPSQGCSEPPQPHHYFVQGTGFQHEFGRGTNIQIIALHSLCFRLQWSFIPGISPEGSSSLFSLLNIYLKEWFSSHYFTLQITTIVQTGQVDGRDCSLWAVLCCPPVADVWGEWTAAVRTRSPPHVCLWWCFNLWRYGS